LCFLQQGFWDARWSSNIGPVVIVRQGFLHGDDAWMGGGWRGAPWYKQCILSTPVLSEVNAS